MFSDRLLVLLSQKVAGDFCWESIIDEDSYFNM